MAQQEQQQENATSAGKVIFADMDVPCPQCEYNLRGLTEPRCPECGLAFDPDQVLTAQLMRTTRRPGLWWVLCRMVRRPFGFWNLPEVRHGPGPSVVQMWLLLLFAGHGGVAVEGLSHGGLDLGNVFGFGGAVAAVTLMIGGILQLGVCLLCVPRQEVGRHSAHVRAVVGYSFAWLIPAVPLLLHAVGKVGTRQMMYRLRGPTAWSLWDETSLWLSIAAAAAAFMLWGLSLYRGGLARSQGNRPFAIVCAILNPFWLLPALTWLAHG